jgi:hypothetical protein
MERPRGPLDVRADGCERRSANVAMGQPLWSRIVCPWSKGRGPRPSGRCDRATRKLPREIRVDRAFAIALAALVVWAKAGICDVEAALIDRGGGLIYDDTLNVTWLADANYARSSGFDSDGLMTWQVASAWASGLVYRDPVRNTDWDDWRLPASRQPDANCTQQNSAGGGSWSYGFNCVGSEMGHLFQVSLGGLPGQSIASVHGPAYALFVNVQTGVSPFGTDWVEYWSATEFVNDPVNAAWTFEFQSGAQDADPKNLMHFAWAVRDGDVLYNFAPGTIPEPAPVGLLVLACGAWALLLRRRTR